MMNPVKGNPLRVGESDTIMCKALISNPSSTIDWEGHDNMTILLSPGAGNATFVARKQDNKKVIKCKVKYNGAYIVQLEKQHMLNVTCKFGLYSTNVNDAESTTIIHFTD